MRSAESSRRVLFFAEAVTLAHLARPLMLAQSLDSSQYEVQLAVDSRYGHFLDNVSFDVRTIHSISTEHFLEALAKGTPLYDVKTLRDYVREDLDVINAFKPDIIVGDFRLSLAVSARVAKVPYITISNIYWSPYAKQHYPVPELPFTRIFGVTLAQALFNLVRPLAFALHTRPMNRIRKEFGLTGLGLDLRRTYTEADITLYADIPGMVETTSLPPHHQFIGAVLWSPPVQMPSWWEVVPLDRPVIYLTPGSSGEGNMLPVVLNALDNMQVTVMVATAGYTRPEDLPGNAFIADYLPGMEAAARSSLVICNGGSPTTQQALAAGVPVLGIPTNLDQYLNMTAIEHRGAGLLLRAGRINVKNVREHVEKLLGKSRYRQSAKQVAEECTKYQATEHFQRILSKALVREV